MNNEMAITTVVQIQGKDTSTKARQGKDDTSTTNTTFLCTFFSDYRMKAFYIMYKIYIGIFTV